MVVGLDLFFVVLHIYIVELYLEQSWMHKSFPLYKYKEMNTLSKYNNVMYIKDEKTNSDFFSIYRW